ncbi:MAG: RHS repeat-associated core domain-containing protein [Planctomycetia bacterium]|nr:RHS repeat-associated core domain-containing protein [Planctomycetia bacterium]
MRDFRYLDPDNWYRARLQGTPAGAVLLEKMHKGKLTTLDSAAAFPSDPDVLRVKCVGSALEVWYNPAGTPGAATLSATDGDIGWGGVALSGWDALFDNLKVGYDADDDDDLDGSDDVVLDEDFSSTSVSPTHDDAGNLTKDADYAYVYDGWNNLVKVRAQNDADVVVGVYAYYADNRRASKTVTNRGDLDGATYFFYDGLREIEERNGAEQVTQQYVWGHEYLDQLLMIRGANGTWFVHQDANWNVIALTTPSGDVAEEVQYQPYGLPQVRRHLAFGDSDADGDVDASDSTARTAALSTYNRAFDADFDGDVSNTSGDADQEAWDASYNDSDASVTMVIPNRSFSPTGNPFLFTGRRLDAETGLYHYRFRTYHPTLKTFIQRDPLGYGASGPSLYQYVGGMPTTAGDPLGLLTADDDTDWEWFDDDAELEWLFDAISKLIEEAGKIAYEFLYGLPEYLGAGILAIHLYLEHNYEGYRDTVAVIFIIIGAGTADIVLTIFISWVPGSSYRPGDILREGTYWYREKYIPRAARWGVLRYFDYLRLRGMMPSVRREGPKGVIYVNEEAQGLLNRLRRGVRDLLVLLGAEDDAVLDEVCGPDDKPIQSP